MSYAQNNKIEAQDFNTIVGSSPSSTANTLNTVWAVGNGNKGYGQTSIPNVTANASISFSDWANLVNTTANIGLQQGTSLTSVTVPVTGTKISYNSAVVTNVNSIYTNRLNAASQGTTSSTTTTRNTTWTDSITFTHTVTFESGDKARYFFNAGGQLALQFSHATTGGINTLFNSLATDCGTVVLSSPTSGSITIASSSYNGITKSGGSGTTDTLSTNTGYYALTTINQLVFKQLASSGTAGYLNSFIAVSAKTSAPDGSNGDNGSTITFTTVWDEVPNGLTVATGSTTTLVVRPPKDTTGSGYLTKTWGTITVTGSVTGT